MRAGQLSIVLGFTLHFLCGTVSAESDWTSWRGPNGDGHSEDASLPVEWSPSDIAWKTPLRGEGQSSPCVSGDRIFLTRSEREGAKRFVFCVDRNDGQILWERLAWEGTPEPTHRMNGWASATCATDGESVFAFFGHGGGLFCYSVNGDLVWQKDLGEFAGPWGTAASPVLFEELVIQNCDADENAFLIAVEKKTGKQVWKTKRDNYRGWSTPVLVKVDDHLELVLNGDRGVYGYNPETGEKLWFVKSFTGRGSPTVTPGANGLLHVVNGKPGDVYAIKPGGTGDVTSTHRVWHTARRVGRDLPSPIVVDNQMLVMSMQGILCGYDSNTGKEVWKGRAGGNYSAAPIAYKGNAFFVNEVTGETVVVKPGGKLQIVAKNGIGEKAQPEELFRSALVPDDGQILLRSTKMLYCIGVRKTGKDAN